MDSSLTTAIIVKSQVRVLLVSFQLHYRTMASSVEHALPRSGFQDWATTRNGF